MSDRLLTAMETGDAIDLRLDGNYPCSDGSETFTVSVEGVKVAQDAKSIKVDRQAMAEWLDTLLLPMEKDLHTLREGRAPWEEENAVHTTRKTPRTISPD